MGELRHRLIIDLAGNLDRRSRRFADATQRMADRHNRSLKSMSRTSHQVFARMERSAARYGKWVGAAIGAATVAGARNVAKLDDQIRQIGVNAGKNGKELEAWVSNVKKSIRETAIEWSVTSDDIAAMMSRTIELTGDEKFANQSMDVAAAFMRAYGVAGDTVAEMSKGFYQAGVRTADELQRRLEIVAAIGESGSFTARDFAQYGPQITGLVNPKTDEQTAEMMGMLQYINDELANPAKTTTSLQALLRVLRDDNKVNELEKANFDIYEKDGKTLKPLMDIVANMVSAADGSERRLQGVVQETEAMNALRPFLNEYNRFREKGLSWQQAEAELRKQMTSRKDITGTENQFRKDADDMKKGSGASLTKLKEIINQFADDHLSAGIQNLAEWTNNLDPDAVTSFLTALRNAAMGLAGLWAITKVGKVVKGAWNAGKWVKGLFGGAAKGSPMAALMGAGGAIPVYIVDGPMSAITPGATTDSGKSSGKKRGKLGKLGKAGGRMLGAAGAGYMAWEMGSAIGEQIREGLIEGTYFEDQLGEFLVKTAALAGSDEARQTLELKEKQRQRQREQMLASKAISTDNYRKLLELRQAPEAEQQAVVSTLSSQMQQMWRERISRMPQEAVNASLQSMRALSTETATATANALTSALKSNPGKLDITVSVSSDGRASVNASPTANPAGFRINTHNTQEKMRNGM